MKQVVIDAVQIEELVKKVHGSATKRGFTQSAEVIVSLKDLDLKKQEFNLNELVFLPHQPEKQAKVCVFAGGDLGLRSKKGGVSRVIEPEELDRLSTQKREARRVARSYDVFFAEASLMPKIGRFLGPFLGPKGKMPAPLPPTAPIEDIVARHRSAVRVRARGQLTVAAKIGDEKMSSKALAENAMAVLGAVERKLPNGSKNMRGVVMKLSMGPPVRLA